LSATELVALVCCDLGSIVRGRSLPTSQLSGWLQAGVGWVPANLSITPLGTLAEQSPFDSVGDLRLLPDAETQVRVEGQGDSGALEFVLCDIVETDGTPWECCPRHFLRAALDELDGEFGVRLLASFEHEFQLIGEAPPPPPFSLEAQRAVEPFGSEVMGALLQAGVEPEGVEAADRSVILKEVVREIARGRGARASFAPLIDPDGAGNGVHVNLSLIDAAGEPLLFDAARPGCLSELAERFAAGILAHAGALSAFTAPSPASASRLTPHRWSVGAICLGRANREALLRIPSIVAISRAAPARQLRLEYRGADATANPYIALGAIVRAGLDGLRAELPAPPILDRDPAALEGADATRFGVGALPQSLGEALDALAGDEVARDWMAPLLYDAYVGVKRAELQETETLDSHEVCRRYAAIY
jgi:glutamine synthetase